MTVTDALQKREKETEELKGRVRTLEQHNDDLERTCRVSEGTVANLEAQLAQTSEKNAMYEADLEVCASE